MALAKLPSAGIEGVDAYSITIEVDVATGLPGFTVVGLADKAVEESKERVRSALRHSGFKFPLSKVTVHLAPSEKHKTGVYFDLPIALALLLSDNQIERSRLVDKTLFLGGLSLDGTLQSVSGALILAEWAKKLGFERVVVPSSNFQEANLIDGLEVIPVDNLSDVIKYLQTGVAIYKEPVETKASPPPMDWLYIQGQEKAKRAAVICASGGHNLLLSGPPGAGKSLLAKGIRSILPPLDQDELLDVVKIHGLSGEISGEQRLDNLSRPFRSPHHSASSVAIIGGGSHPRPGEITLAHRGVLLMDEIPEYQRPVLEALRQPLEDGEISVSRVSQKVRYPARFILVATMNPCPCGFYNTGIKECRCSPGEIERYRQKISGPILDRLDIFLPVKQVEISQLENPKYNEDSYYKVRALVASVWRKQKIRNHGFLNSELSNQQINNNIIIDSDAKNLLRVACEKLAISGRGYFKTLKVAQTIADLSGASAINKNHLAEALQYRFEGSY